MPVQLLAVSLTVTRDGVLVCEKALSHQITLEHWGNRHGDQDDVIGGGTLASDHTPAEVTRAN